MRLVNPSNILYVKLLKNLEVQGMQWVAELKKVLAQDERNGLSELISDQNWIDDDEIT